MQRREIHFYGLDNGEATVLVTPSSDEGHFTQEYDTIQRPTIGQIALISGLTLLDAQRMNYDKDDSIIGNYIKADRLTSGYRAVKKEENMARITVIEGSLREQRFDPPDIMDLLRTHSDFFREFTPYRNLDNFGPQ